MEVLQLTLQVIGALVLLNVWLIYSGKPTRFQGGEAKSIGEDFAACGLPAAMMYVVGGLEVIVAVAVL